MIMTKEKIEELNLLTQRINILTGFLLFYKQQNKEVALQNSIYDALNGLAKMSLKEAQNAIRSNSGATEA